MVYTFMTFSFWIDTLLFECLSFMFCWMTKTLQ